MVMSTDGLRRATFDAKPPRLEVEVKNDGPIELADLTASLNALARQYQRFSSRNEIVTQQQAKLYVDDIRPGSVTATLVPWAAVAAPIMAQAPEFVELSNNLLDFAKYIREAYNFLVGKQDIPDKDRKFTARDLRELAQIVDVTAKDHNGSFSIKAYDQASVQVTVNYNTVEANAIQNRAGREIAALAEPEQTFYPNVLMYWHTASRSAGRRTTDKVVIDNISERALPVSIPDETIKQEMLAGKDNPFLVGFIVDVELLTVRWQVRGYRVLKLHETLEDKPDESTDS